MVDDFYNQDNSNEYYEDDNEDLDIIYEESQDENSIMTLGENSKDLKSQNSYDFPRV